MNKKRFVSEFGPSDEDQDVSMKPADYKYTFSGNSDDCFRIGLKFTRKTVKLFSAFEQSDIIIASPLGLRLCLMPKKDKIDSDFLSSIEVMVLGQAHIFTLQNMEHLDLVLENLNKMPKEAKDCDFSRVRNFYLDGKASHVRQTLIFSEYATLEINRIFRLFCKNYAGSARSLIKHSGCLSKIVSKSTKQVNTYISGTERKLLVYLTNCFVRFFIELIL